MAEDHVNSPTEYQLMEEEITSSTEKIYILTSSSLPSHIRTVEMKHGGLLSDLNTAPCSSRTINIILILVFVFVTSLTVSIAVYKITEVSEPGNKLQSIFLPDYNSSDGPLQLLMTTERENSTFYPESNITDAPDSRQRHCAHKCQLYLDEKFKSDCISGRCICKGENYQLQTCLPYVGRCKISKGFFPFVNFSMANISTPAYTCRPNSYSSGNQLYIVSLYGNHYAKSTIVKVKDVSMGPVTLVLANYYPVSWKVIYQGNNIQSIILASQFNVDSSSVEIIPNNADEISGVKPTIRTMQIPVGFGTDVHNSQTVEMMKILLERFGNVRSFAGADYADHISVRIESNS